LKPRRPVETAEPLTASARPRPDRKGIDGISVPSVSVTVDKVDRRAAHSHKTWVGDGVRALNVPEVSLADYSPASSGNIKRLDSVVDWLQERGTRLDDKLANRTHHRTVLGAPATNTVIDTMQSGFWEAYRFGQRIGVTLIDEILLNGIENGVDSTINAFRSTPAEVIVE
jgi:hypothetical protein